MTDKELMQQTLYTLEHFYENGYDREDCFAAITTLLERLAQPEQEPVQHTKKYVTEQRPVGEIVQAFADLTAVSIPVMPPVGTKLYTAPPRREWVGLTDDDIQQVRENSGITHHAIKTIEAKIKEKNHD